MADGLFLTCCQEAANKYKGRLTFNNVIIDNCCMQLVARPEQFDVIVTGNLYGNILAAAGAGLVGGVGFPPGFSEGPYCRIYEQGSRHTASDIAGKNIANPVALIQSSMIMLHDMNLSEYAKCLDTALMRTLEDARPEVLPPDFGPKNHGTTKAFTDAIIGNMILPA